MSGITTFQGGQSDLELVSADAAVLLAPYFGTAPILTLEDAVNGGLDAAKIGSASPFRTVGNWTKAEGVSLLNSPTINDEESHGKGSPTRRIPTKAGKGIRYTPQEHNLLNLRNAWGFPVSAVTGPSSKGGILIGIPELPERTLWRAVLLAWDSFNGKDIFRYWIANRAETGERQDQQLTDGAVDKLGVSLTFDTDRAVGKPVLYGVCGDGWLDLNGVADTGFYPAVTAVTVAPDTANLDSAVPETEQLTVTDSNSFDRTAVCTFESSAPNFATVSSTGLITAVAAGSATITATYTFNGVDYTDTCAVTVT